MTLASHVASITKETVTIKLIILGVLFLGTLIPLMMVGGLIDERAARQREVEADIGEKWAREQTLYGAALSFPYMHTVYDETAEGKRINARQEQRFMHVLPESVDVTARIVPEIRSRGIFSTVVYTSAVDVRGTFSTAGIEPSGTAPARVFDAQPVLSVGIDDLGGIRELSRVTVAGSEYTLASGVPTADIFPSGVSARIARQASGVYAFAYTLSLRGSDSLLVSPLAQTTSATLTSTYTSPSFIGSFLPDTREVTADSFTAGYSVLEVNRYIPHAFDGALAGPRALPLPQMREIDYSVDQYANKYASTHVMQAADLSTFGVTLRPEISTYDKVRRSVEYGFIFILLMFIALFSTELFSSRRIHPIQYALVAAAITTFYILLLALSEQMSFGLAYALASGATYALLLVYLRAFIAETHVFRGIAGMLALTFAFFYVLLQLEDYAVLAGSLAIFAVLAVIMVYTRSVNWYALQQ